MAGLAFDFCVGWSAVDGRQMGFDVAVIQDATRGINTNGSMEATTKKMQEAGVDIISSTSILK